jgi:hypothetical protein
MKIKEINTKVNMEVGLGEHALLPVPPIQTYSAQILPDWSRLLKRSQIEGSSKLRSVSVVPYTGARVCLSPPVIVFVNLQSPEVRDAKK